MKNGISIITIIVSIAAIILSGYVLLTVSTRKVIVSFNTNSTSILSNLEIMEGESINLPVLEQDGYEFLGWYINDERIDSNYKFDKPTVLNAKWEKVSTTDKTYTVTFDTCISNEKVPIQIVKEGELATQPVTPKLLEENFCGWWLSSGSEFDFSTPITSDITLEICQGTRYNYRLCSGGGESARQGSAGKPIIYLYPEKEMDIEVKLGSINNVTTIYPKYNNSWNVKAYPNGKLIDKNTGRSLYSLYWEGKNYPGSVTKEGFVIKGEDTSKFLEEKLAILGLTEREAEEFIIYWLPQMEHNKYNYIKFAERNVIDNYMPLEVNPKPDTTIRIMMEFMPLDKKIIVKEQKLNKVQRKGFTVVEWGGSNLSTNIIK